MSLLARKRRIGRARPQTRKGTRLQAAAGITVACGGTALQIHFGMELVDACMKGEGCQVVRAASPSRAIRGASVVLTVEKRATTLAALVAVCQGGSAEKRLHYTWPGVATLVVRSRIALVGILHANASPSYRATADESRRCRPTRSHLEAFPGRRRSPSSRDSQLPLLRAPPLRRPHWRPPEPGG